MAAAAALALLLGTARVRAADPVPGDTLLARPYALRAAPSFPGGLFHWIDSLAGTSAGKTVPAHRQEFLRRFGRPTPEDKSQIAAFVEARAEHFKRQQALAGRSGLPARGSVMLGMFCEADTVEAALEAVKPELSAKAYRGLAASLAWFRPKYEAIWDHGAVPETFLARARRDPGLAALESILTRIVAFYGVDPAAAAAPRLALVPVPEGYGTHAETIGGVILVEIRPDDGLADEASVIVHENAHWLWSLVPKERQQGLVAFAEGLDEASQHTFSLFGEAIPTALGQGVADRRFRPASWSPDNPWYHVAEIDRCAKSIYPLVRATLSEGRSLDRKFLRKAFDLAAGRRARSMRLKPRSP
jgi:hypothetical protein